jgi:hypothetical protein
MIEADRMKYVWYRDQSDELFDLDCDPAELTNLIDAVEHHETVASLRSELDVFLAKYDDPLLADWRADQQIS